MNTRDPRTYPEFTLTELCRHAGITPPIMKKFQMLLQLGVGEKIGQRTYYSAQQGLIYKRAKELRLAGVEYEAIVALYELEQKLEGAPGVPPPESAEHEGEFDVPLVFFEHTLARDPQWQKNARLAPLIHQHTAMKQRIARKAREVSAAMSNLTSVVAQDEG